jgi:argininosuccinate lyase
MAKKLWGGRFTKKINPLVGEFTKSIQYDYKLAEYDILSSIEHVKVLKKATYLTSKEASRLNKGLYSLYHSVKKGTFKPDYNAEDIHTDIQNKLAKKVGSLVLKLHTARSRNEQVVFATKLYCKSAIQKTEKELEGLKSALATASAINRNIIIPGFTHLQHAQPVYLKDYLSAYIEMLKRDSERLEHISENISLTMGAGALAGTPIDASKYENATVNSLDAISDRDLVIEIISALSILAMHLSRLAEDLIIWSTKEFDFVEIDESFCTGSSLMPQKKNPDVLELVRGYAGRIYGNLISVLTMMKGLPLTYNRDMQLDKEPLFDSFEIVSKELKVLEGVIETLKFNKEKIKEHLKDESLYATDLVYYLVKKEIPFSNAHAIIGKLIRYSIDNGIEIENMAQDELRRFSDKLVKNEIVRLFDPEVSVKSKKSIKRG